MTYSSKEIPYFKRAKQSRENEAFPGEAPVSPSPGNAERGMQSPPTAVHASSNEKDEQQQEKERYLPKPDRAPVSPLSGVGFARFSQAQINHAIPFDTVHHAEFFCKIYRHLKTNQKPLYHDHNKNRPA